jgi:hypothetical protein
MAIVVLVHMGRSWNGVAKMKNPNLTKWLEMVWSALAEPDQRRRDQQLHAVSLFLRDAGLVSPGLVAPGWAAPDELRERDAAVGHLETERLDIGQKCRAVSILELFEPGESWSFLTSCPASNTVALS